MTIIERILETATKRNINLATIAKKINKKNNQVTYWRDKNCNPPAEYIQPIAELLGVSISWLLTGVEEESAPLPEDEIELLNNYRKLSLRDKKEVHAITKMKLDAKEPEGIILNSKTG